MRREIQAGEIVAKGLCMLGAGKDPVHLPGKGFNQGWRRSYRAGFGHMGHPRNGAIRTCVRQELYQASA